MLLLSAALAACDGPNQAPAPVARVVVTMASASLTVGQSEAAIATLRDASGNVLSNRIVAWSSSAASVAAVSATGLVVGVGPGSATITARSEGVTGSTSATVATAPVATVSVGVAAPLGVGQSTPAAAVPRDAFGVVVSGRPVSWSSSSPDVATVSTAGLITALRTGSTVIAARIDGIQGSARVDVNPMTAASAPYQTGAPAGAAVQPPAVRVTDPAGNPLSGVIVEFVVTQGGGVVTGSPARTDAAGVARASGWVLGGAGAQTVRATSAVLPGASVDFNGSVRDPGAGYDVTLRFLTPVTDAQARAFVAARERIQVMVVGDLSSMGVDLSAQDNASCLGEPISETVDDILILVQVAPIDGVGNVLGQSRPCWRRATSPGLPVVGYMTFDSADLARIETVGMLEQLFVHEMLHVLGFGTLWDPVGLLVGLDSADPYFTGAGARDAFLGANGGHQYGGTPVPVEGNSAPVGTRNAHWRNGVFGTELMTGFLDRGTNPLSATTIGSLGDLGYQVNLGAAEPFMLAPSGAAIATGLRLVEPLVSFDGDVAPEPPRFLGADGRPLAR